MIDSIIEYNVGMNGQRYLERVPRGYLLQVVDIVIEKMKIYPVFEKGYPASPIVHISRILSFLHFSQTQQSNFYSLSR